MVHSHYPKCPLARLSSVFRLSSPIPITAINPNGNPACLPACKMKDTCAPNSARWRAAGPRKKGRSAATERWGCLLSKHLFETDHETLFEDLFDEFAFFREPLACQV